MNNKKYRYIRTRELFVLFGILIVVAGCGTPLKNSWNNFRAYYNTYYNAKKHFRAGLQKVENQPRKIDPADIIRIHPPPIQAGNSDFQKAIDKGAKILRKFPDSKWVDNALLLIGKSYYYRQEFYPARQKFEELRNAAQTPEMKQQAIIWKGRTQLDLENYSEAVNYLEQELKEYPDRWSTANQAEIRSILAQHHAMLGNWEQAVESLSQATASIKEQKLLGRAYFLYGQVLERLGRYGEASFAYSQVGKHFPGYEYIYWAEIKRADVARKVGSMNFALSIYQKLRNDDKNFERIDKIEYEIARTLEMKGDSREAERRYKKILYGKNSSAARNLRGQIYFRLGEIYSESYNNFETAAAYYDTASTYKSALQQQAETDAQSLADIYSEYTRLRKTVGRADSLLWLGSLSLSELDSVLENIRRQKRKELRERQESTSQNSLVNRNTLGNGNEQSSSTIYGFLNHRNRELVAQAKSEFNIIWGDRPLVDHWRRIEAVRQLGSGQQSADNIAGEPKESRRGNSIERLNIGAIPRSREARNKLVSEKANAQYRLGNLFFLNLSMPDSARHYFYKVMEHKTIPRDLRGRSMYSLYELFNEQGETDSLQYWADRIIEEYPDSKYAGIVREDVHGITQVTAEDKSDSLRKQYQLIASSPNINKPSKLRKMALENRSSDMAPHIYYKAIEEYIRLARAHRNMRDSLVSDMEGMPQSDSLEAVFLLPDSLESRTIDQIKFQSVYWDSVRIALHEFDTTFTNAKQRSKVLKLLEVIEEQETDRRIPDCEKRGISLRVLPSMNEFLSVVKYPDELKDSSFSGQIRYSFVVTKEGEVQSYQLVSAETSVGIEEAFEQAFDQFLRFAPLEGVNAPEQIRCTVTFPVEK